MRVTVIVITGLLFAACGGSAPPPDSPKPKVTMESQREPFMEECMKTMAAPDYCDCGWEQFRIVFKDSDLSAHFGKDDPRVAELRQKTQVNCASKFPEEQIKASYLANCMENDSRRAPYCECAWPALRKKLAPADFVGEHEGPRFDDAKKGVVTACKGKYPVELAKVDFMKGCTSGNITKEKRCDCLWTTLRTKYGTEALVLGTADLHAPELQTCK
jgi:hypothetical protein